MSVTLSVVNGLTSASSRAEVRSTLAGLASDLSGETIVVDLSDKSVVTRSFLQELLRVLLIERNAATLELADVPRKASAHARRLASELGVADRVVLHQGRLLRR
ncbi:MAG TPA: hypothetical protein VEA78_04220 [Acidimicrobiales bacterium]|nr:hypothetical protein [Acidimicrobiales bacterium]